MIATLLRDFAALFTVTDPRASADRRTWLLVCIVLAGAVVRFWGLGAVGLHGDEKTMALPAMNLVEHGSPLMPSGFLYPRAVGQLYLMAASVQAFGQSEWSLRLPSALCGVLLILLAWRCGQRFLTPTWNLALTAAVAFLPDFIEDAQTARMYVFLVTSVAGFMALIFEWERTERVGYLAAAVAVMLVGLQFHTLAIFAAFLVFIPGLLTGEQRKFWAGALAFAVIVAGFVAINHWIATEYPQSADGDSAGPGAVINGPQAGALIPHLGQLWLLVAVVPALALSAWVAMARAGAGGGVAGGRRGLAAGAGLAGGAELAAGAEPRTIAGGSTLAALAPVVLLTAALVAEVALSWHLASLLVVAGLVMARRNGELSVGRFALFFAVSGVLAVGEAAFLLTHAAGSPRQIVGAMLGWPSVWPFYSVAQFSIIATVFIIGALARGLWRLAHRQTVPDHLLLVVLGLWIPLLMIGFIKWDIPSRYAEAQIMPMLLGGFAAAQWVVGWWLGRRALAMADGGAADLVAAPGAGAGTGAGASARTVGLGAAAARAPGRAHDGIGGPSVAGAGFAGWGALAAALTCVLVINPLRVAKAVDSGYATHPDHKGAAEFVAALHPGPRDIIIAEDVLQQTYYLGHVDYWLVNKQVAAPFMHRVNGQRLDLYTNTRLIGTGEELEQLVARPDRGAIYVIGSGENQEDGRGLMRAFGISEALRSSPFRPVYRGRDGLTQVWKVDAPRSTAVAADR